MRRPLRSKRAITSPLRARSKASGLTRIRVRLTAGAPLLSLWFGGFLGWLALGLFPLGGSRFFAGCFALLGRRRGAALTFTARTLSPAQRVLAVGAEGPLRVHWPVAARAGVLEATLAVGTTQEVLLDRESAPRTGVLGQLAHAQLRRFDLELAFVGVLEELRWPHDRVDRRTEIGDERGERRAADQEGIRDAPLGVEVGVDDQRQPDDDQPQDEQVDDQVEAVVIDPEGRECHG